MIKTCKVEETSANEHLIGYKVQIERAMYKAKIDGQIKVRHARDEKARFFKCYTRKLP